MTYSPNDRLVPVKRLHEVLAYEPLTGALVWRRSLGRAAAGARAGSPLKDGRRIVTVDGIAMRASRIAWTLATGRSPNGLIDHRDGDPSNDRWANLREATKSINNQNQRRAHARNGTGLLGAGKSRHHYRARIWAEGRDHHLGVFDSPEAAHAAYVAAKRQLHAGGLL